MNSTFWFEKYKPTLIQEVVGQDKIKDVLRNCLINKNIPHLLLHGYSGVGKSIIISNFIKQYYGSSIDDMVLQLNSTDERGIKVVREKINSFSKKIIPKCLKDKGILHKLVILEDAETITNDAQTSLRRCVETYSNITRFCIICNNKSKIIEPIISRCCQFFFDKIKLPVIYNKLEEICISEKMEYDPVNLELISKKSNGDIRKAITTLQTHYYLSRKVSDYLSSEEDNNKLVAEFVNVSCNGEHNDILQFNRNTISQGYNIKEIIININTYVISDTNFNIYLKKKVICNLSNIYRYISFGSDELIQLMFLSYIFRKYNDNN